MRFLRSLLPSLLLSGAGFGQAAPSWSFDEAVVSVNVKGGAGFKDKYGLPFHGAR
jgi:oligosaccharyltransferase complex subunit delta (ribophorin II)